MKHTSLNQSSDTGSLSATVETGSAVRISRWEPRKRRMISSPSASGTASR